MQFQADWNYPQTQANSANSARKGDPIFLDKPQELHSNISTRNI